MTQASQILDYLLNHPEGITPLEALEKFGCFRLGARIHDIRNGNTPSGKAYPVETINETKGGKTYARYKVPVGGRINVFLEGKEIVPEETTVFYDPPKINLLPERTLL